MRNIKPVLFVTVLFIITFLAYGAVWYKAEAQTIDDWSDNFDSYNTGDLAGNGFWATTTPVQWDVTATKQRSGSKSITTASTVDAYLQADYDFTSGTKIYTAYFYPTANTVNFYIAFRQIGTSTLWGYAQVFNNQTKVGVYNDDGDVASTTVSSIVINTWNKIDIEANFDLGIIRSRINSENWTDYVFVSNPSLNINKIEFHRSGTGTIYFDDIGFTYNSNTQTGSGGTVSSFISARYPQAYTPTASSTVQFALNYFYIDGANGTVEINVYDYTTNALVYTDSQDIPYSITGGVFYSTTTLEVGKRHYWTAKLYNQGNSTPIKIMSPVVFDVVVPLIDDQAGEGQALLDLIEAGTSTSTQSSAIGAFLASIGGKFAQKHPFAWVIDLTNLFIDLRQNSSTTTLSAGVNFSEINWATSSPLGAIIGSSTAYDIKLFDSETMFSLIPESVIGGLRALLTAVLWVGLAFNIFNRARNIV